MIIGVDGNEANVKKRVGVSFYTLKLLECFKKESNDKLGFIIYLKNKPLSDLPQESEYFKYITIRGSFLWSQIFLPLKLFIGKKVDVFFSPAHYAPRFCPVPTVVTIHDLSYLYFPDEFLKKDLYQLKNWTKYSIEKSSKIIAVSKTTKKDLMNFYNIPDSKIEVIYNGYEKKFKIQNSKFKIKDKSYILYVGTLQPRKNILTLIRAFAQFKKQYPRYKLRITGKKGWLYNDIFNEVVNLKLEKSIIFTDYISEEKLVNLYKNADFLVLPSYYEGFGIPLLEAMSFGCPVISSFASSLPEIGGDACLYFDPINVQDLLEKMLILKKDSNLYNDLIKKSKERVKLFSWKKCAQETLNVIKSLLK